MRNEFTQREPVASRIVFSTEARGLTSHSRPIKRMPEAEEKAQAKMMAVALAQPHRRGNPDKKAGDPIWDFCGASWPSDKDHCHDMWRAGIQFGNVCRQERTARELNANGTSIGEGDGILLTEAEIVVEREKAKRKYNEAIYTLRGVDDKCSRRMELLCYDLLPPIADDYGRLKNGLWRLAVHFGIVDFGINQGKWG